MTLEEAQENHDRDKYKYLHRAVLVFNKKNKIVGKISQLDVLRSLEPDYGKMMDRGTISRSGYSTGLIRTIIEKSTFLRNTLTNIYHRSVHLKVKDFMYTPTKGEYVEESETIEDAIHKFIIGHHQSLIVTRGNDVVGILRVTDVFNEIFQRVKKS